jgi:hypothetical protein
MKYHPKGRAVTSGEKRAVIERIYAAWVEAPEQRLGQLIANAIRDSSFFNVEDRELAQHVENFVLDPENRRTY